MILYMFIFGISLFIILLAVANYLRQKQEGSNIISPNFSHFAPGPTGFSGPMGPTAKAGNIETMGPTGNNSEVWEAEKSFGPMDKDYVSREEAAAQMALLEKLFGRKGK